MTTTPRLGLTYLAANQSNGEALYNAALNIVDALMGCRVTTRTLSTPPSAALGDVYIVGASATGAWSGHDGELAIWYNSQWTFIVPQEGMVVWLEDEQLHLRYVAAAWEYVDNQLPGLCRMGARRYRSHADRGAATRTVTGAAGATPAGTIGNTADEAEGPLQSWTTTAVNGNAAGNSIFTTGATGSSVQLRWKPIVAFKIKTGSSIASLRIMCGLAASDPSGSNTPAVNSVLLRYSTGSSDTGWRSYIYNGSGVTSSKLADIAADTGYLIVMKATSSTTLEIWIGSDWDTLVKVQTITSGLPSSSTDLYPWLTVTTLTAATKTIKFGQCEVEHN